MYLGVEGKVVARHKYCGRGEGDPQLQAEVASDDGRHLGVAPAIEGSACTTSGGGERRRLENTPPGHEVISQSTPGPILRLRNDLHILRTDFTRKCQTSSQLTSPRLTLACSLAATLPQTPYPSHSPLSSSLYHCGLLLVFFFVSCRPAGSCYHTRSMISCSHVDEEG